MKTNLTKYGAGLIFLMILTLNVCGAPPVLNFVDPTPDNNTCQNESWIVVNVSVQEENLSTFKFNWAGTDYIFDMDSLVLGLHLNNNANDYSKYGNDGTVNGAAAFTASGKYGSALTFDGTDDYVDCGNDPSLDIGDFTIEAWVKRSVAGTAHAILSKSNGFPHELLLRFDNTNKISLLIGDKSNSDTLTTSGTYETDWYHVVVTWIDSTKAAKIYVDGNEVSSDTLDYSIDTDGISFVVGASVETGSGARFNGIIDEVHVYNRALTLAEIQGHYNNSIYYDLDKSTSDQWYFSSNITGLSSQTYTYSAWANNTPAGETDQTDVYTNLGLCVRQVPALATAGILILFVLAMTLSITRIRKKD